MRQTSYQVKDLDVQERFSQGKDFLGEARGCGEGTSPGTREGDFQSVDLSVCNGEETSGVMQTRMTYVS